MVRLKQKNHKHKNLHENPHDQSRRIKYKMNEYKIAFTILYLKELY